MDEAVPDKGSGQEDAWIQAAQKGDRDAFDALVEMHGRAVLAFLQRLTGSAANAEDLAQETLLRAYSALKSFQPGGRFRAWLFTIAYHEWVHVRRKKNRVRLAETEELDRYSTGVPDSDAVASNEVNEAIRNAVSQLPEDQRTVVWLRFAEGLSHEQIAEVVKAEPATVRWRLFRARQVMQKVLAPWVKESKDRPK